MRTRTRILLALPLAALAIAGCGGGDDDSTATTAPVTETTTTLSKEELISRGDAVCAEVNAAVGTVGTSSPEGTSQVGQVADLYIGMVESLKALGTPDDAAGYPEFIAAGEELAQAESDAKLADERGDSTALGEAQTRVTSTLASFQAAAEAYGFEDCGQEPSAPSATTAGTETPATGEAPEEEAEAPEEEAAPEAAPEEAAPETGGAGGGAGAATGGGEAAGGESGGGSSGGIGPG
jgi:uncharacterized membrane protein YgcG